MHPTKGFNSRLTSFVIQLKFFPRKLKSRWFGPFRLTKIHLHSAVDLKNERTGHEFMVNE